MRYVPLPNVLRCPWYGALTLLLVTACNAPAEEPRPGWKQVNGPEPLLPFDGASAAKPSNLGDAFCAQTDGPVSPDEASTACVMSWQSFRCTAHPAMASARVTVRSDGRDLHLDTLEIALEPSACDDASLSSSIITLTEPVAGVVMASSPERVQARFQAPVQLETVMRAGGRVEVLAALAEEPMLLELDARMHNERVLLALEGKLQEGWSAGGASVEQLQLRAQLSTGLFANPAPVD